MITQSDWFEDMSFEEALVKFATIPVEDTVGPKSCLRTVVVLQLADGQSTEPAG